MISCIPDQNEICDQQDVVSKTVITEKQFSLDSLNYNYLNKYKLEKVQENEQAPLLKIKNLPCVMNGNQLKKITQIEYGSKKYYIEDVYIISSSSSSQGSSKRESKNEVSVNESQPVESKDQPIDSRDSQKAMPKKCCLFRKPKGKQKLQKRNTKNVAKNFCKAFLNHLKTQRKHRNDKEKIQNCIHQVKTLIGHKKYYNNNVIWKIISSNVCKQYFKIFLEEHAHKWIQKSKMEYKDVHFEAVDIYLKLYEKMTFLEGDEQDQDESGSSSSEE